MFLNRLNPEEKVAFLELAHHIARSDNDFSNLQKEIISGYCMEMQITDIEYNNETFDLVTTLNKIESEQSKKIILLEVMALIYSDDILHEGEKKILNTMIERFQLNNTIADVYTQWSKSILALTIQGEALLHI
ncbi:MAG: Unknown protein [uncultured Campylobacterales bacterium]|uniref:Co-chaperone DjlA N-terminal domain-containing protein n=1 Tax=uncultured Campylobacterales bacterium TaxID=352960 RepID=A0A6S6TC40_9BACT|nr:MAG: Unknown protein [uncultured Campylobacterales bacterium]